MPKTTREEVATRLAVLTRYTGQDYIIGKQMEGYRVETGPNPFSPRFRSLKPLLEWVEGAIKGAEALWLVRMKRITFWNDDADRFVLECAQHWVMEGRQIVVDGHWVAMWESSGWTVRTSEGERRFKFWRIGG